MKVIVLAINDEILPDLPQKIRELIDRYGGALSADLDFENMSEVFSCPAELMICTGDEAQGCVSLSQEAKTLLQTKNACPINDIVFDPSTIVGIFGPLRVKSFTNLIIKSISRADADGCLEQDVCAGVRARTKAVEPAMRFALRKRVFKKVRFARKVF